MTTPTPATRSTTRRRYFAGQSDALVGAVVRPRPRYLDEEFLSGLAAVAVRDRSSRSLEWDEARYMVWRLLNGAALNRVVGEIGRPYNVANRMLKRLYRDAAMFSAAGVVVKLDLGGQQKAERWYCRSCGFVSAHRGTAENHAWDHLWGSDGVKAVARVKG